MPHSVAADFAKRFDIPSYDILGMGARHSIFQANLEDITPISAAGNSRRPLRSAMKRRGFS
jgi:hypothetical protein